MQFAMDDYELLRVKVKVDIVAWSNIEMVGLLFLPIFPILGTLNSKSKYTLCYLTSTQKKWSLEIQNLEFSNHMWHEFDQSHREYWAPPRFISGPLPSEYLTNLKVYIFFWSWVYFRIFRNIAKMGVCKTNLGFWDIGSLKMGYWDIGPLKLGYLGY